MKSYEIAVLAGDGIGPEVMQEAVKILRCVEERFDEVKFEIHELPGGAGEYLRNGDPFSEESFERAKSCDAILLGAMGLPDVRGARGTEMAPQLDLRERLDLYCGLRPLRLFHEDLTPLRSYRRGDIDFLIVRENTEGLFFSRKHTYSMDDPEVRDILRISRVGSERLFRSAFREAENRRGRLTLIDKSNVLPSMAFFREIFNEISEEFPGVQTERIYIDAASLYLVQRPQDFDVIVTENLFGDILSDLAAGLVGGMGLAPSADVGDHHGMFQPSHGSAPDIAGQGAANPIATILSVAMMLDWLKHPETVRGAAAIRQAVEAVLQEPELRTRDLGGKLTTTAMGDCIMHTIELDTTKPQAIVP